MILYHFITVTKTHSSDKPALEDLHFFLEFQVPRQWAPLFCELPLRHQRKKSSCPSLQFAFLGPKINVSSTQVICQSMDKHTHVFLKVICLKVELYILSVV